MIKTTDEIAQIIRETQTNSKPDVNPDDPYLERDYNSMYYRDAGDSKIGATNNMKKRPVRTAFLEKLDSCATKITDSARIEEIMRKNKIFDEYQISPKADIKVFIPVFVVPCVLGALLSAYLVYSGRTNVILIFAVVIWAVLGLLLYKFARKNKDDDKRAALHFSNEIKAGNYRAYELTVTERIFYRNIGSSKSAQVGQWDDFYYIFTTSDIYFCVEDKRVYAAAERGSKLYIVYYEAPGGCMLNAVIG